MTLYAVTCSDELHFIECDENNCLHLLDHNTEEEEALSLLGDTVSTCFDILRGTLTDPNATLWRGCWDKSVDLVKLALDMGADPTRKNSQFLRAAAEPPGNLEIIDLLLHKGADVHANDDHAICLTSEIGRADIVKALLSFGADPEARNHEPLRRAIALHHKRVIRYLVEHGAPLNVALKLRQFRTPFSKHKSMIALLVKLGADEELARKYYDSK